MKKFIIKTLALALTLALFLTMALPSFAEDADTRIHIKTAEDLKNIANDITASYVLDNNIVFEDGDPFYNITGIFSGTLDGNGYGIYNLQLTGKPATTTTEYIGIFQYNAGTVKNLEIYGASVTVATARYLQLGGIAAGNVKTGRIQNCLVEGNFDLTNISITATTKAGGIIGDFSRGTISGCISDVDITYSAKMGCLAGGIAAEFGGNMLSCINRGDIRATSSSGDVYVGGLAANIRKNNTNPSSLSASMNFGKLYGESELSLCVGGLAASMCSTNDKYGMTYCISAGEIEYFSRFVSGISGAGYSPDLYYGAVCGKYLGDGTAANNMYLKDIFKITEEDGETTKTETKDVVKTSGDNVAATKVTSITDIREATTVGTSYSSYYLPESETAFPSLRNFKAVNDLKFSDDIEFKKLKNGAYAVNYDTPVTVTAQYDDGTDVSAADFEKYGIKEYEAGEFYSEDFDFRIRGKILSGHIVSYNTGDFNLNKAVTITDAVSMRNCVIEEKTPAECSLVSCDFDESEAITVTDIVSEIDYIINDNDAA